jgi:hypothetical protein
VWGLTCLSAQVLRLACGHGDVRVDGMSELLDMEAAARAFQIGPVQAALQAVLLARLTPTNCAAVLARRPGRADDGAGDAGDVGDCGNHGSGGGGGDGGAGGGGGGVWGGCVAAARRDWDAFAESKSFLDVPAAALEAVLAADGLCASCEEAVFLDVVRWIRGRAGAGALRGEGLLKHVRFPLMSAGALAAAAGELPGAAGLAGLVAEAEALLGLAPEARASCVVPRMVASLSLSVSLCLSLSLSLSHSLSLSLSLCPSLFLSVSLSLSL